MRNIAFKGSVRAGLLALGCMVGCASAEAAQTGLRIAHIADPQVGFITSRIPSRSEANYAANYARDLEYVKAMIPLVNAERPDLVLIAGDLMQNAADLAAEWPALLQKFDAPVLIAPGNHDMGNNVTAANLERFRTLFGAAWTSRSLNGYRIIVMNSQFWYATDGSAAVNDAKQAHDAWLDAEIAAAVAAGEKIILCSHIPPFENTVDEADSYFNCPKATRTAFMDKLIANGVDYWLCGHTHTKTQHQYANANGTLNIWTAEAVCENFDGTPSGFQVFEIPAGQTTATWRNVPIKLPVQPLTNGFVRFEYVEANGTQWIDTGYKPNPNSQIYFKFATSDIENSVQLFGCVSGNNRLRVMRRKVADATTDGLCFVDMSNGGENFLTKVGTPDSDIHEIFASNDSKTYDGEEFGETATKPLTATIDKTLYLMKWNNFTGGVPFAGRVYACKISEGGTVKLDLVPALRVSDGVIGLYNLAYPEEGQQFFASSGEPLAAGLSPDAVEEVEYILADGNQYIDTGYKPNPNSQIYFKFATTDLENSLPLFGCATTDGSSTGATGPRLRVMRRKTANEDAQENGVVFVDMSSTKENINGPKAAPDADIHEIFVSNASKIYDGEEFGGNETSPLNGTIDKTLYLMKLNNWKTEHNFWALRA